MKKARLLISFLLLVLIGKAQTLVEDSVQIPVSSDGFQKYWTLRKLPSDYATSGSKTYALLVFCHGAGQGTPPLKNLYNSPDGGVPYQIEHGAFDGTAVNPATGATEQLICLSPQNNSGWSISAQQLLYFLNYVVANYRVDVNRIYLTGLSAGGVAIEEYVTGYNMSPGHNYLPAATAIMSYAEDYAPGLPDGQAFCNNSVGFWGFGDSTCTNGCDGHGQATAALWDYVRAAGCTSAPYTAYEGGHCCWAQFYTPAFTQNITYNGTTANMSQYQWFLLNNRGGTSTSPTAFAGTDQSITQPTSTVTLSGSGSAGSGHSVASYAWSKISGPSCTVTSPSSASTTITGMTTAGSYSFKFTVTNEVSASASDTVVITVNAAAPVANAGSDQTITLPTSSVTLNGSGSVNASSYSWTRVSGPNTPTIVSSTSATTSVTGLVQGTYVFQLSINSGASTDQMSVMVNPASAYPACGSGTKYAIGSGSAGYISGDTGFIYHGNRSSTYKPGDTLVFGNSAAIPRWKYIELDSFAGNPSCPLVITYSGTQTLVENLSGDTASGHNGTVNLFSDSYIKVDGNKGTPGVYGFLIQGDPVLRYDLGAGAQITGTSHTIEWVGTKIRNIGTGLWMKNNGDCDWANNYPNPGVDSVFFHDNWIVGTWNEGMYIGNTSPDNAPSGSCAYDQRPITCGVTDTTFFPVPPRIGDLYIYNNIVDSTGRGGIQFAAASVGTSYCYGNTVKHNGMNHDRAQGTAISVGTYSRIVIHDNNCDSTYTWGIALLGASNTGFVQQIYNNHVNHSGYGKWYDLATTSRSWINPFTEPISAGDLSWPQNIYVDTKPTCNPIDSTAVFIANNVLDNAKDMTQQIKIENDHNTLELHGPNVICSNQTTGGTAATIYIDPTATGFTYSTSCALVPTVNAGSNQSVYLPTNSATLVGSAMANNGASISHTLWTLVTGPNNPTITNESNLTTTVTGLIAGTYIFRLTATDSNNLNNSASVSITVIAVSSPGGQRSYMIFHRYRSKTLF